MRQRGWIDARRCECLAQRAQFRPVPAIEHELRPWCVDPTRRNVDAEIVEEAYAVTAPARSHRSSAKGIFEDQVPPDDPSEKFAQRRVAIGVCGTCNGNERGKFGVTEAGERTDDPR